MVLDFNIVYSLLSKFERAGQEETPSTPIRLVREMLEKLPPEIWSDPSKTFLDPACSTGTFLLEIVRKLNIGLASQIPDQTERLKHILTKQVWGLELSRVPFFMTKAAFEKLFIDTTGIVGEVNIYHANALDGVEEIKGMKFDVVVGNPPYQKNDGGGTGSSATALYSKFWDKILEGEPSHVVVIMPARWHTGGRGLTKFRENMLNNDSISKMTVYHNSKDCFPDNDIKGGICHVHYDANYSGDCEVTIVQSGNKIRSTTTRKLNQHLPMWSLFLSEPKEAAIVDKVRKIDKHFMKEKVSSSKPFGLRSSYISSQSTPSSSRPIKFYQCKSIGYVSKNELIRNHNWIGDWKVLIPKASEGRSGEDLNILGQPIVAAPNSACSETYLVVGRFNNKQEADNLAAYINTKFFRFMVSIVKKTQNSSQKSYSFVPQLSTTKVWTDKLLYDRYNLTKDEIDFIEKRIKKR